MRAEGYYWVKEKEKYNWGVLYWDGNSWLVPGISGPDWLKDTDMFQIDERRIERNALQIVLKRAFEAGMSAVTYNGRPGYPDAPKFDEWYQKWKDKS